MKRSTLYKIALTGLSLTTAIVFQNCGKLDIQNLEQSSLAANGASDTADGAGETISLNPPVESLPSAQAGQPTPISVSADANVPPATVTNPGPGSVGSTVLALCDSKVILNTMPIVHISNLEGSFQFNADQVKQITNIRGGILLRAVDKDSIIYGISNIVANDETEKAVVLCNFNDVKHITDIRGQIVLINTHLERLTNHIGKLILINSQVDNITNRKGELISLVTTH